MTQYSISSSEETHASHQSLPTIDQIWIALQDKFAQESFYDYIQSRLLHLQTYLSVYQAAAIPIVIAGLFLCFAGKKYTRTSTSLIGGMVASFMTFVLLSCFHPSTSVMCVGMFVAAALGAFSGVYFYHIGLFAVGLLAGVFKALLFKNTIYFIFNKYFGLAVLQWITYISIVVYGILGVCLMYKIESVIFIFASSMIGATLVVKGLDCSLGLYLDSSFWQYQTVYNNRANDETVNAIAKTITTAKIDMLSVSVVALAVLGAVVQFLNMRKSRKN